ncbi:Nucleotide-binding universal stress protein, UspA family [Pricia antarctica]|uniref:Nucleotide-binding universal stress protein, UspA family n=1 Tax=Pricia antarctica TaxID=641691 RepID=A0A1G6YH94_9FLAO|nr:universal stress protein [Pricia antarctica]SDD88995.1 Nucleotide-binding universal stress protein, UspA family [Pricia antarctica]
MKILLAIDGSEYSQAAVNQLAKMPFSPQTEVRIISVFDNSLLITSEGTPMGGWSRDLQQADAIARKAAMGKAKEAAKLLKEKNPLLLLTTTVQVGSPKHAILDEAEAFGANLIVVGSHGHSGFSRFLLGSVSQSVAMHAHCSVMIVRKQDE